VPGLIRVLVVEDDPDTLAVATVLRDEFAVWVARDGEQALEVADELGFNADAVVLDLDLGRGMRGDPLRSTVAAPTSGRRLSS
jgi:DNA-binding response OmpR family regulator